jgi:hypothetical protein
VNLDLMEGSLSPQRDRSCMIMASKKGFVRRLLAEDLSQIKGNLGGKGMRHGVAINWEMDT